MRQGTRKIGGLIGLSTAMFLSSVSASAATPKVSTWEELNEPAFRTSLIRNHWTTAYPDPRLQVETAPISWQERVTTLQWFHQAYHQNIQFQALLLDLWNRKGQQVISIVAYDRNDGRSYRLTGKFVDYNESGERQEPYLTLEGENGRRLNLSIGVLSFTALIREHGFRELYEPSWQPGKNKACRSLLF